MDWEMIRTTVTTYALRAPVALIIIGASYFLINFLKSSIVRIMDRAKIDQTVSSLLSAIVGFLLWILSFTAVFNTLGLSQISLALGGSVAVLALGVANSITGVVGDLVAGVFLIADPHFKVGCKVKTSGVEGVVESLDIRKTKIRDTEGNLYVVPNRNVDGSVLIIEKNDEMRCTMDKEESCDE
jgi:small-conductance mechanosensitive channel